MEESKAGEQDRGYQDQGLSILNSVIREDPTEKVTYAQRPDAGQAATVYGKQMFQAEQQVAAGTLSAKALGWKHAWRTGRMSRKPVFQAGLEQKKVRSGREQRLVKVTLAFTKSEMRTCWNDFSGGVT